jgi:molecular chaperone GrpE
MSEKKANKMGIEDADPETAADAPVNIPDIEDLIPGLADEIEAAAAQAQASMATATPAGVIAQLEADCYELKDKLLRALAESENIRRRAERDRKDAEAYGGTKLARDLLAVHDSLARTLESTDEATREQAKGFIEGVELTQRELLNAFTKHKIEKVTPAMGEKFDPNRHQAMFEAPIPGAEPGTVIEVMQAGFNIADRLLRPALVGVARAAPQPAAAEPELEPEETGSGENGAE